MAQRGRVRWEVAIRESLGPRVSAALGRCFDEEEALSLIHVQNLIERSVDTDTDTGQCEVL